MFSHGDNLSLVIASISFAFLCLSSPGSGIIGQVSWFALSKCKTHLPGNLMECQFFFLVGGETIAHKRTCQISVLLRPSSANEGVTVRIKLVAWSSWRRLAQICSSRQVLELRRNFFKPDMFIFCDPKATSD